METIVIQEPGGSATVIAPVASTPVVIVTERNGNDKVILQEVIQGTGSNTYTPGFTIDESSVVQIFRDGTLCRPDPDLSEVLTYKIVGAAIVLSDDLESDEYIHIFKL